MDEDTRRKTLIMAENGVFDGLINSNLQMFPKVEELIDYGFKFYKDCDSFDLYIPGQHIDQFLSSNLWQLMQVKRVTFYFDSANNILKVQQNLSQISSKFIFCLKAEVENRIRNNFDSGVLNSSKPLDSSCLSSMLENRKRQVQMKQKNLGLHEFSISSQPCVGFNAGNINSIKQIYQCRSCSYILRDPVQLPCGHRLCKTCVENYNGSSVICSECHEETVKQELNRFEMEAHYLTQEHQLAIINCIRNLLNIRINGHFENESEIILRKLQKVYETIDILVDGIQTLNNDVERHSNESRERQELIENLTRTISLLKLTCTKSNSSINEMKIQQEILLHAIESIRQKLEHTQVPSYDGIFIWKIINVQEKMMDAQSERQTSIYSPPFYSSRTGYKMCARLHLNGVDDGQGTHMSLFLVLMKGNHDGMLSWPFNFRIIFNLYDQTDKKQHIIDTFRPDVRSSSFQRPRSEMNIASGIPKFCPLAIIEQANNRYVRDNSMYIKIMVDFSEIPNDVLPFASNLNPGLSAHRQHELIQNEIDNIHRAQQIINTTNVQNISQTIVDSYL
ncbi:unnamed protein product [Rotaria sp. Silwood2]|nr:unnamed protein product [Rotaria sp. Silwood2]